MHVPANLRHLYNPANLPEIAGLTAVALVGARRQRLLLVNVGPNHGLIDITFAGQP
jgi:hypothetical protein